MRVEARVCINAPRERIWEMISRPGNYTSFFKNLTRWEVEGDKEVGLGARYQMRMHVRSAEAGGLIEVVEFDEPGDMAWTSILGVDHRGRWRLREREDGGTDVTFRLSYQSPGGVISSVTDRLASPDVRRNLTESLQALKREVEGVSENGAVDGPSALATISHRLRNVGVLARAGVIRPDRPDRVLRIGLTLLRWGPTPAAGYMASATRYPDETAIIDDLGTLSFREVHVRTNALAHAFSDAGIKEGDGVGVMCRNHRGFIETTVALSKLGAHALFLNTAFAGPQLTEVVQREKPVGIVYDQEFAELLEDAKTRRKRFVAWHDEDDEVTDPTLDELIEQGDESNVVPPAEPGRVVILTSGTTGTPKGATRKQPDSLDPAAALLSKIPLRAREINFVVAPLFHSWGFAHFTLGMALSSTILLRRKFDPEETLATIAQHEATSAPMVPVMLQRILDLPEETRAKYDLPSLRTVPVSGSALPGELATRFMDEFGDVIYNLYGSTEVAWATIATPQDLRQAPGTAGKPPAGTVLKIYDENGSEVPTGQTGRIFVGNEMLFEGYTGGGGKDMIDGLMSTGDVGHVNAAGHLFVEGRDDEMIVSGGENVFPQEVEDLLARHKAVSEVAVIGVDDEKFGQRLKAYVVKRNGAKLTPDEVQAYVKSNLARFKVPREVEFIDELPRNATGKVLKRELKEREEAGSKK